MCVCTHGCVLKDACVVQLRLRQHGFELSRSTYIQGFSFNKYYKFIFSS